MSSVSSIGRGLIKTIENLRYIKSHRLAYSSSSSAPKEDESAAAPRVPKNLIKDLHTASQQPENGLMYDKKPFKLRIEAGKRYAWCLCGRSRSQPLCDGTHKNAFLKIKLRPVHFVVDETKEYWLCNCKQTSNRPFCDGTHKRADIQEAVRS